MDATRKLLCAALSLLPIALIAGCAGTIPQSVVYGKSGRAFTAPDDAIAWQQCLAHDAPCRTEQ